MSNVVPIKSPETLDTLAIRIRGDIFDAKRKQGLVDGHLDSAGRRLNEAFEMVKAEGKQSWEDWCRKTLPDCSTSYIRELRARDRDGMSRDDANAIRRERSLQKKRQPLAPESQRKDVPAPAGPKQSRVEQFRALWAEMTSAERDEGLFPPPPDHDDGDLVRERYLADWMDAVKAGDKHLANAILAFGSADDAARARILQYITGY